MATKPFVREQPPRSIGVSSDVVELRTEERVQFIDLTELVAERVRRSGVGHGLACVQTGHTTTAVVVSENEALLIEDAKGSSETLAVADGALQLGRGQRVFLVELDGPRRRSVCVVVMGIPR
jgi:thiamine phosphate synthase YjbQ (UPF0047 family)